MFLQLENKDGIAIIDDENKEVSYHQVRDFASTFFQKVGKRTLIFILAENDVAALLGYVACLSNRIVPLIISANTDAILLKRLLETYQPEYVWTPDRVAFNGSNIFSQFSYTLFKTAYTSPELYSDLALLLSTSGSTGSPKLVRHSYLNVERNARNVAAFFELSLSDRPIVILPIQYTMGLSVITSHLYSGATILLTKRSLTESQFWNFIKAHEATSFTGVPYSFEILEKLRFFKMDLPHLKLITQGGGKLKEDLFIKCAEYAQNNDKRFIATYGQTEGTARMTYLPAESALTKTGSIGKAIPEGELLLIDENGKEITDLEATGQMVYRGPNVTLGYATGRTDLAKGDENLGELPTGDIARRDSDGFYYIVGRANRFLKLFGIRIGLDEVEELVRSNFETDCACSGNDEKLVIAITSLALAQDVKDFIVMKTGIFHQAIEVLVVDRISRSESGKILYRHASDQT